MTGRDYALAVLPFFARSIACHTRSGVAGMSICDTPSGDSASSSALMMVGGAPMVPELPMSFPPSGSAARIRMELFSTNGTFFAGNLSLTNSPHIAKFFAPASCRDATLRTPAIENDRMRPSNNTEEIRSGGVHSKCAIQVYQVRLEGE